MNSMRATGFLCRLIGLATCLTVFATRSLGDPTVLTWNDAAETNLWDATSLTWLDSTLATVAWQSGAEAHFTGSGGTVQLAADVTANNLAFTGSSYLFQGTNTLTLEGTATSADGTVNGIAASLLSSGGITKSGTGTLNLLGPSAGLGSTLTLSQGTLGLQHTAIPGALSVAAAGTVAVLPTTANGLMGYYYDVAPDNLNFSSYDAMERHFAYLTPSLVVPSSATGTTFDFGSDGSKFPFPYGNGGTTTTNFEAVWRGTITLPESTYYSIRAMHDDALLIAIDRQQVFVNTGNATDDFMTYITAGTHDIVIGFGQGSGEYGLQIQVHTLADNTFAMLPNALLTPYTSVGSLSGSGAVTLADGALFNVAQSNIVAYSGTLTGTTSSRFTKNGFGTLTLASGGISNTLESSVAVENGTLALATAERVGNSSTVSVASRSSLKLYADETLGALAGAGTVTLGDCGYAYHYAFSGSDADSGISTANTYTHLLDLGASASPAVINGVTFSIADMNGSTNGYGWSTVSATSFMPYGNENAGTSMDNLLGDFCYAPLDYTLTLSGLTPGKTYESRFYFKSWGDPGKRFVTLAFTAGNAHVGSVDHDINSSDYSIVGCRYTADDAGTLQIHVISHSTIGDTCHLYGMTNQEAPAPIATAYAGPTVPDVVAFTDDSDSTISPNKIYTHLLDFPAIGNPATVNGVTFTAAGMNGSANGYSWSTVNPPTEIWNASEGIGDDSVRTGVDRLLWDFIYNSTDFTMTLAGLHPGQTYETHIYFRYFGELKADSPRDITATFTAGSTVIGSVNHDLDTVYRSMIRCRYTADAAGTLQIRVYSYDSGSTCHVYGLSNEEVPMSPTLTLNTPAGAALLHSGAINGSGYVVKQGDGAQALSGADTVPTPIDVRSGSLVLQPGASIASGVVVRAGATFSVPAGSVFIGGLQGEGTFNLNASTTNQTSIVFFTSDATTGISTNKVYTHLMDFGLHSPVATINGVTFTKVSTQSGTIGNYGWVNFPPSSHDGNGNFSGVPTDSGIYNLLYDMDFGWTYYPNTLDSETMQLTGLTPGKRYEVHLFNRAWGWGGDRSQRVTFDPDGDGPIAESITFNPDQLLPNYVAYRYTAVSSTLNITVHSLGPNMSLHLYGLSNEEVSEDSAVVSVGTDSVFGGPITGGGNWIKTGSGKLTVTNASSTAWGALAVNAGAFGVANGGCATLGDVTVADGATLFGDGSIGGNVSVASNAWLFAGTATACGTLHIGGSLTLADGAQISYRFSAGSADTVNVDGLLTFPTNGVLNVSSLSIGAQVPAKDAVFVSQETINGPEDLTGWTVEGANRASASIKYSDDHKTIYFSCPNGTLISIL